MRNRRAGGNYEGDQRMSGSPCFILAFRVPDYDVLSFEFGIPLWVAGILVVAGALLLLYRPTRRRACARCAVISLLLCLVVAATWLRSAFHIDSLELRIAGRGCRCASLSDGVHLTWLRDYGKPPGVVFIDRRLLKPDTREWLTFSARSFPGIRQTLIMPHWFAMLPLLIAPGICAVQLMRQRRRRNLGLCLRCGYDLRASTERCPECGKPITSRAMLTDERQ
jgi:hypothetical protein